MTALQGGPVAVGPKVRPRWHLGTAAQCPRSCIPGGGTGQPCSSCQRASSGEAALIRRAALRGVVSPQRVPRKNAGRPVCVWPDRGCVPGSVLRESGANPLASRARGQRGCFPAGVDHGWSAAQLGPPCVALGVRWVRLCPWHVWGETCSLLLSASLEGFAAAGTVATVYGCGGQGSCRRFSLIHTKWFLIPGF